MDHKNLFVTLKADAEGSVKAVFATLDVIDKDGDVIQRGAFNEERVNIAAWGHNWADLPAGDGVIKEKDNEAIFEGDFYLGTPQGDATYQTLKQRQERGFTQEWSFGFDVMDAEPGVVDGKEVRILKRLKVYEVSPVMVGAGQNTRTLAVKALKEEAADVKDAISAFYARMKERFDFRKEEKRSLSAANREDLQSVYDETVSLLDQMKELIEASEPGKGSEPDSVSEPEKPAESVVSAELPDDVKALVNRHLFLMATYGPKE